MDLELFNKKDELRLRTLQRLSVRRIPKSERTKLRQIFTPATILILLVSIPVAWVIIAGSKDLNVPGLGYFVLALQIFSATVFFAFPSIEKIIARVLIVVYFGFYVYLTVLFPESHGIYIYIMFTFPPFVYATAGSNEALSWSLALVLLIATTGSYHLENSASIFTMTSSELLYATLSMVGFILLIHVIDMVARYSSAYLHEQTSELEHTNARYDFVFKSIGDGFVATDTKGIVEFVSDSALELTGFKRKDIIGSPLASVFVLLDENENTINIMQNPITRALNGQTDIIASRSSEATYRMLKQDQSSFPVGFTMNPIVINEEVTGAVMLFHDTTSESQIDHAKNEFVSLASHQLRTPLNVVSWYAEKLKKGKGGELNEKGRRYLEEIETSNQRMIELVGAILNVSRIELGRLKIQYRDVDIIDLTKRLVQEVAPLADKTGIIVAQSYMSDSHTLKNSDLEHTTVIVQNLLSNAVKYTNKGDTIRVEMKEVPVNTVLSDAFKLKAPKDGIVLSVSDTGIGIPQKQQDQIFGKLFRADNAQSTEVNGTGLGLYVTKSLVEQMGGAIWFTSEEKVGSTFAIYLPNVHDKAEDTEAVKVGTVNTEKNKQVIDFISEL